MDPLFGSETRSRVLEQLALVPHPQTAYRVAAIVAAEPIQVLRILKALDEFVQHTPDGWVLTDEPLRRFLIHRFRREEDRRRTEKDDLLARFGLRTSHEHQRGSDR